MEENEQPILLDVLVEPIVKPVDEVVEKLGSEDLEYNLSFSRFTKNLIFGAVKGVGSVGKLIQTIRAANSTGFAGLADAGKTSYHEAFHRYDASLFRKIFLYLATSLPLLSIPELNDLGRILLVDGSVFPAIANMSWATYQSDHNAIKLHLFFELNRMIPVHFACTNANASEKKSLSNHIECATTYVCDRGYFAFWLLAKISTKKAFFTMDANAS